jgi:hypothetical protein
LPRVISSAQTFASKFILPVVVAVGMTLGLRGLHFSPVFVPLILFLYGAIFWFLGRCKKVTLEKDGLLISNYFREVRVPLRDIVRVTGSRWINTRQVTIEFDRVTGFGRSIVFLPHTRFLWPGQEHPIAQELRELVLRAKAEN